MVLYYLTKLPILFKISAIRLTSYPVDKTKMKGLKSKLASSLKENELSQRLEASLICIMILL